MKKWSLVLVAFALLFVGFPVVGPAEEAKAPLALGIQSWAAKRISEGSCDDLENQEGAFLFLRSFGFGDVPSFLGFLSLEIEDIRNPRSLGFGGGYTSDNHSDFRLYLIQTTVVPTSASIDPYEITFDIPAIPYDAKSKEIYVGITYTAGNSYVAFPITIDVRDAKVRATLRNYSETDATLSAQSMRKGEPIQITGIVHLRNYRSIEEIIDSLRVFKFDSVCKISAVGSAPTN